MKNQKKKKNVPTAKVGTIVFKFRGERSEETFRYYGIRKTRSSAACSGISNWLAFSTRHLNNNHGYDRRDFFYSNQTTRFFNNLIQMPIFIREIKRRISPVTRLHRIDFKIKLLKKILVNIVFFTPTGEI